MQRSARHETRRTPTEPFAWPHWRRSAGRCLSPSAPTAGCTRRQAWFTTGAFALVAVQVFTSLRMWDRVTVPRVMPAWFPALHRWSGTAAFLLTLPVAFHCLWALGFQDTTTRQLVHSVLGCAFYGAFTTKMLALRADRIPSWSLPILGGLLAAVLTGIWLTSSLWFFINIGFPGV